METEKKRGNPLKWILIVFLIVAVIATAFAMTTLAFSLGKAADTAEPFSDLVARLVAPATPVILPDPITILHELNAVARLETAEYVAEKIIRAEREQDVFFGAFGETLLFVAVGEVIAGIDLGKMSPGDIQVVDPVTVMVYLPEAEIFSTSLDNDRSYVADRDTGIGLAFVGGVDANLETEVRRRAEGEIESAALEIGILETAAENAQTFMRAFLQGFGFENIIFTDTPPPPAPAFVQPVPKGREIIRVTPEAP